MEGVGKEPEDPRVGCGGVWVDAANWRKLPLAEWTQGAWPGLIYIRSRSSGLILCCSLQGLANHILAILWAHPSQKGCSAALIGGQKKRSSSAFPPCLSTTFSGQAALPSSSQTRALFCCLLYLSVAV